jgi:hypothetical protein
MRRDGPGHGGTKPSKQAGLGPMDPDGFLVSKMIRDGICSDCTVLSGKADLTFEDGSPAGIDVSDNHKLPPLNYHGRQD